MRETGAPAGRQELLGLRQLPGSLLKADGAGIDRHLGLIAVSVDPRAGKQWLPPIDRLPVDMDLISHSLMPSVDSRQRMGRVVGIDDDVDTPVDLALLLDGKLGL